MLLLKHPDGGQLQTLAAFTLAEVLIVLGIIGLIADMTLPTLVQSYQDKVVVVKLNETYSVFDQAFKMAVAEKGTPENWGINNLQMDVIENPDGSQTFSFVNESNINSSRILFNNLSSYMKLIKTCSPDDDTCIVIKESGPMKAYSGVLANGVSFYVYSRSASCKEDWGSTPMLKNICALLHVDLDGNNKGKNKTGADRNSEEYKTLLATFRFHDQAAADATFDTKS